VIAPPYFGFPILSHQFPFALAVVVVEEVETGATVDVVLETGGVMVVFCDVIWVKVVAEVAQDTKTRDVNTMPVNTIQIAFLFIDTSRLLR
jgi:hypothetical protein